MDADTRRQVAALLDGTFGASRRPLLVCDVDEVVLHLVAPFEAVLLERGYELRTRSFKLTGNIFHAESGAEATQADVWEALQHLFEEQAERQTIVPGVVAALTALAADIDIVFLTNMPHPYRATRARHLEAHGLTHPLVTNTGTKATGIAELKRGRPAVGFVDDTPINLTQVAEAHDDVHLFHFMADETFRAMVDPIAGVHVSTGDWAHAAEHMRRVLVE